MVECLPFNSPPPSPSLPNSLLNYVIESFLEKVSESLWHGYKQRGKPDLKYKQFGFINCLICSWDGWYRLIMIEYKLQWTMGKRTGRHMTCLAYALIVAKLIFSNSHANLPKSGVGEKCIFFFTNSPPLSSVYVCMVSLICYLPHICMPFIVAFSSGPSFGMKLLQYCTTTHVFLNSSLNPLDCWIAGRWREVRLKFRGRA